MNKLLLIASIGRRMQNGDDIGTALFGAAVAHEDECEQWEMASRDVVSKTEIGEVEEPAETLAEFFNAWMPLGNQPTPEMLEAIKSLNMEQLENGKPVLKVQLHDKMEALRLLGEHAGYFDNVPASRWQRLVRWFKGLV